MSSVRIQQTLTILFIYTFLLLFSIGSANNESIPDFYTLKATSIDGEDVSFEKFRGKVALVINIANTCSYADAHFRNMGRMLDILGPHRFAILAFPCSQFGQHEPGTLENIKHYLVRNYGAEYTIFKKIDVIGGDAHPVYRNLAAQVNQVPDWNFWKYLIDEDGRVMNSWGPKDRMEDIFLEIRAAVIRLDDVPPALVKPSHFRVIPKQEL
ncbi:Glutathione peroxidase 7 [Chamberlinius hualienensis]